MAKDRFLIAPIKEGLRTDLKPWLLPEDSFEKLSNAYMYEGRIRKRFGSTYTGSGWAGPGTQSLFSRLRISLTGGAAVGITDGAGAANGTVPGGIFKIGQLFSIGDEIFTVYQLGVAQNMLTTVPIPVPPLPPNVATYDTTNGNYVFTGAAFNTQIYFYPAEPVMGLTNFETNVLNNRPAIAFDTQFVYQFAGGFWTRIGPTVGSEFNGTDVDFFQASNWHGLTSDLNRLFVTNFNATAPAPAGTDDPMWYYDGTGLTGWTVFSPKFLVAGTGVQNIVVTAKIILPFKDRLILLNTIENDAAGNNMAYSARCRFSHNGSPLDAAAWLEKDEVGYIGGGWIEAPTKEEIVGAEYIKDRLIVYFERSTWELAYTGNQLQPFIWQKINTELGSESTFSSVPFDKAVLTIGTTGIHACNGANVERIDSEIPDQIFKIRNDFFGPLRVAGIRDYFTETVYWTFPASNSGIFAESFPNKVLVYNYKDGTWAINDDSITAFGYFEQQTGTTWASTTLTWRRANFPWNSGVIQPQFRKIIAGNQHGFVFKLETDVSTNESVLQISDINAGAGDLLLIDVVDHNFGTGDYIKISNCQGATGVNGNIYRITANSDDIIQIEERGAAGVYTGGGTIARVSRIDILTKRYNPYIKSGKNISIDSVDFAVMKTVKIPPDPDPHEGGQITIDCFPSSSNVSTVNDGITSGAILGTNILETYAYDLVPLEAAQELLWHRIYFGADGDSIQLRLYMSDDQMVDPDIVEPDFKLEGFILNLSPTGRVS